jgi:phosphate-selective porin OprO and OprP
MKARLFASVSAFGLAVFATPLFAQQSPEQPTSGLDTLEPSSDETPEVASSPTSTGNPVLDRLNALEARVKQLEARNAQLEAAASDTQSRVERVEVRSAKAAQPGVVPTFADVNDNFTFKPRGTFQIDYAGYNERLGGYDYNNGTDIRRARFGFEGTAYKHFKWRIEAEYVKNTVNLLDAYVSYGFNPKLSVTVGQHKAPYGLEANTSDAFNTFLERGMASNAFGAVGAERRVGISLAYASDKVNGAVGLFGSSEAVTRNATTPDEGHGINGRITWDPINDAGKIVHLGVSGYHVTNFPANSLTVSDRPNVRVDDGRIISAAIAGTAPIGGAPTGVKAGNYYGGEALLVRGPFSLQGEYGHLSMDRFGTASTLNFDGFNVFGSWFVSGEARTIKNGVVDRLKPFNNFDPATGNWGAVELAFRYDELDLTDLGLSPLRRKATSLTGAVNWYLNPNAKILFNYIRFKGINSPLVVAPVAVNGTTAKGDAFATRFQFDF